MTAPTRLRFVGARRGQGTTTVALAAASHAANAGRRVTVLVDDLDDACAVCGVPVPVDGGPVLVASGLTLLAIGVGPAPELGVDLVVEDVGLVSGNDDCRGITVLVVRGPDYLALRTALTHPIGAHGVVVVREPWRALGPADVSSVLGLPVIAEIPHSDAVARATDAGLLLHRASSMRPFSGLQRLVDDGLHPAFAPEPAA